MQNYEKCTSMKHFVWEKLNTGLWKDIPDEWRFLYSIISGITVRIIIKSASHEINETPGGKRKILNRQNREISLEVVRMCDLALLMGLSPSPSSSYKNQHHFVAARISESLGSETQDGKSRKIGDKGLIGEEENLTVSSPPRLIGFEGRRFPGNRRLPRDV